jgi:glycine oxidase
LGECDVSALSRKGKGWAVAVKSEPNGPDTVFEFDRVVLATGAATERLAQTAGFVIPLENVSGALVMLSQCPPGLLKHVIITPGLVMLQRNDGHVLIGTAVQGDDAMTRDTAKEHAQTLKHRAEKLVPQLIDAKVKHAILETRPVPRGGRPMVGYLDTNRTLYVAVMHQGISLCGSVGMLAAEELTDSTLNTNPLSSFRPPNIISS